MAKQLKFRQGQKLLVTLVDNKKGFGIYCDNVIYIALFSGGSTYRSPEELKSIQKISKVIITETYK